MRAAEIVTALRRHYGCESDGLGPEWAALDEMAMRPGASATRIDLLCIRAWSGKPRGHERHAVEVKVSRSDLRREIESAKWQPWASVTHRFYLAVPADLSLDGIDLPDEWGVLRVSAQGVKQERRAPRRDPDPLPETVTVAAFRRASRSEARIRDGGSHGDKDAEIARLSEAVTSASRAEETARTAERRWEERARHALDLYAQVAPEVRCRCGTPVRVAKRAFRRYGVEWEHVGEPGTRSYFGGAERPCDIPSPDSEALAEQVEQAVGA